MSESIALHTGYRFFTLCLLLVVSAGARFHASVFTGGKLFTELAAGQRALQQQKRRKIKRSQRKKWAGEPPLLLLIFHTRDFTFSSHVVLHQQMQSLTLDADQLKSLMELDQTHERPRPLGCNLVTVELNLTATDSHFTVDQTTPHEATLVCFWCQTLRHSTAEGLACSVCVMACVCTFCLPGRKKKHSLQNHWRAERER